ncbi:MAG: DUF1570 domain-containing protein [Planctomycetes bacterium]|nr:DUF1570 domain-containing protein [Planctomycetota bacterium]
MSESMVQTLRLPLFAIVAGCLFVADSQGQVDPRQLGFNIPPGPIQAGEGRRVVTPDESGQMVVGRVHVQVGKNQIVMLPDGKLVVRGAGKFEPTERPFKAATKDAIAKELLAGRFNDFHTKQTGRYLFVYNTSKAFADTASIILETMVKGVVLHAKAMRVDVHEPTVPLVVIMFRTEAEFQKFRRMPAGVVAYYNILSNRVLMYEQSKLWKVDPRLAIQQSLSTIAHEGAHQILHNIGMQKRLSVWPMWLSEGLAEYFAPTSTGNRLRWKGAGKINDMRMFELERYLTGKTEGWDGKTIEHTVAAARLTSTGYASAWALTHYLAKMQRPKFNEFVRHTSKLGPLEGSLRVVAPGVIPDNVRVFREHFANEFPDLEKRLFLYLRRQPYNPPFAGSPHYVAMIRYPNGRVAARTANMFFSKENADRWLQQTMRLAKSPKRFRQTE